MRRGIERELLKMAIYFFFPHQIVIFTIQIIWKSRNTRSSRLLYYFLNTVIASNRFTAGEKGERLDMNSSRMSSSLFNGNYQ